jgi:2-polyprenyl-6-methoxyphenol hydroxylase-like FAD-dependent oxidoreductase
MIDHIEKVLAERVANLSVKAIRHCGVDTIIAHDSETVTFKTGSGRHFRSRWLAGCDGGRSVVRMAAGIELIGTEALFAGYAIKCDWDCPKNLKPGFHANPNDQCIVVGTDSLYLTDFDGVKFDRTREITIEHFQALFERASGEDNARITKIHLA